MATAQHGGVGRFGARYGRTTKEKFGKIEAEQRGWHKCPYCHAERVKRISFGLWGCRKCGAEFTGKAYTVGKRPAIVEEKQKKIVIPEEPEEERREELEGEEIKPQTYQEEGTEPLPDQEDLYRSSEPQAEHASDSSDQSEIPAASSEKDSEDFGEDDESRQ